MSDHFYPDKAQRDMTFHAGLSVKEIKKCNAFAQIAQGHRLIIQPVLTPFWLKSIRMFIHNISSTVSGSV